MKADYKNWMPKGMAASFFGGTAGALAIVPAVRLLMPEGTAKSVVTAVSAAAGCAFGGASIWSYLMYRAFDYNGTRQMSKQIIEGITEYVDLPEGGTCLDFQKGVSGMVKEKPVIAAMSAKKLRLRKRYAAQKRIKERKLYAADVKSFDKANFQFAGRFRE